MYHGNDEARKEGMAHYNDLRETYARHMEYHGCGFALFQPISARDMTPPCCGYFDRNGDWNLICSLSTSPQAQKPLHVPGQEPAEPFAPLKYDPVMSTQINIEWQPKTSQDVEAHLISGGGQTPDTLPAGADVQIKYASKSKFGAVLMTLRPITLHAYNDERLFVDWLTNNKALLFETYGTELKKYGMWVVTRTYNAPGCSINAWQDNSKESIISLKAKASMLGELADGEVKWNDKMVDKDWSHYKASRGDALVVFMDGIETNRSDWLLEGIRQKFSKRSPSRSPRTSPQPTNVLPAQIGDPLDVQRKRMSAYLAPPPNADRMPDGSGGITTAQDDIGVMPTWSENTQGPTTHGGTMPTAFDRHDSGYLVGSPTQKRQARHDSGLSGFGSIFTKMDAPEPWDAGNVDFNSPVDDETLKDAGMQPLSRRSVSIRRRASDASARAPSIAPSLTPSTKTANSSVSRAKSLRRETRSISGQSIGSGHARQRSVV